MSDRDEANGQFASAEPLTGREGVEQAQGYTPYEPPANEEDTSPISVEDASLDLTTSREAGTPEADIKRYGTSLDDLPPEISITAEQAAELTSKEKAAELKAAEEAQLEKVREGVDKARCIEAEKALPADVRAMIETGVDEDVAIALTKPQVRQAVEQEFARADQVREQNTATLRAGEQMLQATLVSLAPQLQGASIEHWPQMIQQMAQTDPVRAELVADTLDKWGRLQFAQQHDQQQRAQIAQQQFEARRQEYSRASDAVLGPMTTAERLDMAEELVNYVGEYGVTREQLVHEAKTNLALNHPAFQKMAADALRYQRMQKAPKAIATKSLPPVLKPGTSNNSARASDSSSRIASLERQLNSASGEKAARISAEIHGLQRKARG